VLLAVHTCGNLSEFFADNCSLTWHGVTLYGTIDIGGTWQSRGAAFNPSSPPGEEYLLQKNSSRVGFGLAPDAVSQSAIGIKGNENLSPGWTFVFDLETGFDPVSLRLANGPGSIAQNAGVPLSSQSSNTDSSRAGQFYNSLGYMGVSSHAYGTLTVFRQNSLTLDGVLAYDPMGGSYAFSPIGYQGITCGVGDTEDCRFTTALKYRVAAGPFRAAALWQFGGYDSNNASSGAYQLQAGGDISHVARGSISIDVIYSRVKDAVAIGLAGNTLPVALPQVLTATLSNDTSWMTLAKYSNGATKLYGGYEWIQYAPPGDPKRQFTDIAGSFLCAGCGTSNNTNINNTAFTIHDKILQVLWLGAKYAVTPQLTVATAYYQYLQNSYGGGATCESAAKATCSGLYNAVSFTIDWEIAAKFDAYEGMMYQTVAGGLSNGFLHRNTIDPTIGLRFRF
jgi:predicted porin